MNVWAIPILRYTAGIVNWTRAELKSLDISTRKLLTMYKCFSQIDDVDRLYTPCSLEGRGLLSVQDTISVEIEAIASYLSSVEEPLLMAIQDYGWLSHTDGEERTLSFSRKQSFQFVEIQAITWPVFEGYSKRNGHYFAMVLANFRIFNTRN